MRQLINNLSKLLEDCTRLDSGSSYLQSEGMEWYDADEVYVKNLEAWADTVEAVFKSAGKNDDVQTWRSARKVPVSIHNVYDQNERLCLLLRQIKSSIEQEYNYAPDLAQVEQTPFLLQAEISDAHRMSELYVILHCYENSVRHFIEKALLMEYGQDWWDKVASDAMKRDVNRLREMESQKRWLSPRGNASPLYYLEWGELVKLIRKQESQKSIFLTYIGSLRFIENRFEELESLRHIVAHNGVLPTDDDFQRVIISFRDWCRQIGTSAANLS